ncbi:MAG: tetratricopeptide repeat protein, partial [Chitinispirillaceae bacterium]|nr:tetratricopeptide repeat protein [Chitinispirillaceae bacterium]
PVEIEAITLKAMAKSAADRYQSMDAFRVDINRYQRGEPVEARPPSIWTKGRHFTKRHWAFLVIAGLIMIFSGLFGLSLYRQSEKERSHWQLVYNEKFGNRPAEDDLVFSPDSQSADTAWTIAAGTLHGHSRNLAFIRLQRRFNRDILLECDIMADSMDLFDAGFYLFGNHPDSGYRFYFNRGGCGRHGISFPGSDFLFYDGDPAKIPVNNVNHIVIERTQRAITYSINGTTVARVWDFLPPLGKNHEHVGLFVNGSSAAFDNLKVSRRAIPQAPSPALIADRFIQRGDLEAALEEYKGLLVDFADAQITGEILIKMADCLVRLQRYDEALAILKRSSALKNRVESLIAHHHFLEGTIFGMKGEEYSADSILRLLAIRFPLEPANLSAMTSALLRSHKAMMAGAPDEALRTIAAMSEHYKRFPRVWGRLHLELVRFYIDKGILDTAFSIAENIMKIYAKDEGVVAAAQIAQGHIYLHRGRKEKAKDMFDLCITAHLNVDGIWEAWMSLADIYNYDFRFKDALTIYQKIHRESPPEAFLNWMAAIEAADCVGRKNLRQRDSLLQTIADGAHPFPLPRLIARFYLGVIPETDFKEKWEKAFPGDRGYLFYLARKAAINKEQVVARIYLNELKRSLPKHRWDYFRAIKIINNLENW